MQQQNLARKWRWRRGELRERRRSESVQNIAHVRLNSYLCPSIGKRQLGAISSPTPSPTTTLHTLSFPLRTDRYHWYWSLLQLLSLPPFQTLPTDRYHWYWSYLHLLSLSPFRTNNSDVVVRLQWSRQRKVDTEGIRQRRRQKSMESLRLAELAGPRRLGTK